MGIASARGATLASADELVENVTVYARGGRRSCTDYYSAALEFSMETWGDIGASQASVAAADLSDTLHFGFTVLDAAGQPTDIPLYLTLAAVPEPLTAAMLLQGL